MKLTHIDLDLNIEDVDTLCPVTGVVVRKAFVEDGDEPDFQRSPAFVAEWDEVELDAVVFTHQEQQEAWDDFTEDDPDYESYSSLIEQFLRENPALFPDDLTLVETGGVAWRQFYSYTLLDNSKAPDTGAAHVG